MESFDSAFETDLPSIQGVILEEYKWHIREHLQPLVTDCVTTRLNPISNRFCKFKSAV